MHYRLLSTSTENEKFKAILREVIIDAKPRQFIEIWDRQHLVKNYDLAAYGAHGEIYTDSKCNNEMAYESLDITFVIVTFSETFKLPC